MLFGETFAVYRESHTEHTDTVRTSQETHYVSATVTNQLMLFGEAVDVYSSSSSSYIATDGRSASSSWCRAPFGEGDQMLHFFK
jgi:hypothetical protein